jgi:hypothetical protein
VIGGHWNKLVFQVPKYKFYFVRYANIKGNCVNSELVLSQQSMGARNRVGIGLSYRPARLYIGWRNRILRINSWAPLKFKNTVSDLLCLRPLCSGGGTKQWTGL